MEQVKRDIKCLIDIIPLQKAQFPILSMTYSTWRQVFYSRLRQKSNHKNLSGLNHQFFIISQRELLPYYINKIKSQMNIRSLGWKKALQQQSELNLITSEQYKEMILIYSELIYHQQLHIQMLQDLLTIPYSQIYDKDKVYLLNQKYQTGYYKRKESTFVDKTCNTLGKNILTKGLTKISESLLVKPIFFGVTSMLGSFNPLTIAASFTIKAFMENRQQTNKIKEMVSQLLVLNQQLRANIKELQELYEKVLCSMQSLFILKGQQKIKQMSRLKSLIKNVLVQDWLQVKVQKEGQWEIVQLSAKQSYQIAEIN